MRGGGDPVGGRLAKARVDEISRRGLRRIAWGTKAMLCRDEYGRADVVGVRLGNARVEERFKENSVGD